MASKMEGDCLSNPNFAVICSFMDRYGETLCLPEIGYKDLQEWIEDSTKVCPLLVDLHLRLLRRIHKNFSSVTTERWEKGVVRFCHKYSNVDAWEIERFGYKLAKIPTKLTLLKNLMESQFDGNNKFKDKINENAAEDMRFQPVGRDKHGMAYWYLLDKELNLRVYREHQDDVDSESWELVCRNRDDLAKLVTDLECGTDLKTEKLESSDQSDAQSDFNEDSRDSFKQKTPIGPSPLTIKQEPGCETDSVDTKQHIILKISKTDCKSPSKMLIDKFVKEKGSEMQKIMCKMKQEGIVDSDGENDESDTVKNDIDEKEDKIDETVKSEPVEKEVDSKISTEEKETEINEQINGEIESNHKMVNHSENISKEGNNDLEADKDIAVSKEASNNEDVNINDTVRSTTTKMSEEHDSDGSQLDKGKNEVTNQGEKEWKESESDKDKNELERKVEQVGDEIADNTDKECQNTSEIQTEMEEKISNEEKEASNNKCEEAVDSESLNKNDECKSELESAGEDGIKSVQTDTKDKDATLEGSKEEEKEALTTSENVCNKTESLETDECKTETLSDEQLSKPSVKDTINKTEECDNAGLDSNFEKTGNVAVVDAKEQETKEGSDSSAVPLKSDTQEQISESESSKNIEEITNDKETNPKSDETTLVKENSDGSVSAENVKSRKRKNAENREESSPCSDEEIEHKNISGSKRTTKIAVRKCKNNQSEENSVTSDKVENDQEAEESEKVNADNESLDQVESQKVKVNNDVEDEKESELGTNVDTSAVKEVVSESANGPEMEKEMDAVEEENNEPSNLSKKSKSKAQKRQAENSDDLEPAETASKKSKLRGRVSSKGRGLSRGVNVDTSSSEDDVPLSKVAGRGRKGRATPVGKQQNKGAKKKVEEAKPEIPSDLSEEDTGRRRSARVRSLRARKAKSPSPEYVPSDLDESSEEFLCDEDDEEFTLKSKKRKKKEPQEEVEEVPKGRNALRHEAQANKNGGKSIPEVIEEEAEETPCVKCLLSHQPEWILLCDKCDAGYHTACLRPPLMIIPDGDWYCPPCEHNMLKEKLEENLKSLDQSILKSDRLVRRKERLAFVSVSLDNVLKEPETNAQTQNVKKNRKQRRPNYRESDVTDSGSGSGSETEQSESTASSSGSEGSIPDRRHGSKKVKKQEYIQRTCRSKKSVSYRFEEFDELIMDAIEEDLSIPKEPKPRKVKPPGISRGKDMSNILGPSDEESSTKPPRKRRPRLTELDEDVDDDDDTDDYQVSEASDASDTTKSYDSEEVSEDSIGSDIRYNSRSKSRRKSGRKGRRSKRYKDDFVVDSDFESDNNRRSGRRLRRGKVNYREVNSDETEVENESFHSSELSDSDFESKRKKRIARKTTNKRNERRKSGKRQRIQRLASSTEETGSESEDSAPKKSKGKKSKSARLDSDETGESEEKTPVKKPNKKKVEDTSETSGSEEGETEQSDSSGTDESEPRVKESKSELKKVKKISDSENNENTDKSDVEKKAINESHNSEDTEESGWEEIEVESEEHDGGKVDKGVKANKGERRNKSKGISKKGSEVLKDEHNSENDEISETVIKGGKDSKSHSTISPETELTSKEGMSGTESDHSKMEIGRRNKTGETVKQKSETSELTPKKRGRKPKTKPEPAEGNLDETPVKRKRGRTIDSDQTKGNENETVDDSPKFSESQDSLKMDKLEGETDSEKTETGITQPFEKAKDGSPLSARNKHNAPVGVVKPEVRKGVIVENKQAVDGRLNESKPNDQMNPLQGMRDLAMGNQNATGNQSSFTPYSQSNFGNQNMGGYMGQPYQNYPHQPPPYGHIDVGPNPPSNGPPNMPHGPQPIPPNQGPLPQNCYPQQGPFMGQMMQGPEGYYPAGFRPPISHPEGFRPPSNHGNVPGPQYYNQQPPYQGPANRGQFVGNLPPGIPRPMPHPPNVSPGPYQGMPYPNYPNMPQQQMPRLPYGVSRPSNMSPTQSVISKARLPIPAQGVSESPKAEGDTPNQGFMMDNILKQNPEAPSHDVVDDSAEVSDIDRYTSFLCKTE